MGNDAFGNCKTMTFLMRQEHTFFRLAAPGFLILLVQIRYTISAGLRTFVVGFAGI